MEDIDAPNNNGATILWSLKHFFKDISDDNWLYLQLMYDNFVHFLFTSSVFFLNMARYRE